VPSSNVSPRAAQPNSQASPRTLFAIVALLATPLSYADNSPPLSVSKWPGWTQMGPYQPVNPRSLAEIPESIRTSLIDHLKARLGEEFYQRLRFTGGQVVDFEKLRRDNPDSWNYRWEIHAYDLHFEFKMPEVGIDSYTAQIKLRRDGTVLKEIDLPNFAAEPKKLVFIPLRKILGIAQERGFDLGKASVAIEYDEGADAIQWKISEVVADDGLIVRYKNLSIHAHNGRVAKVHDTEAIR
jgi:hypothetical protein